METNTLIETYQLSWLSSKALLWVWRLIHIVDSIMSKCHEQNNIQQSNQPPLVLKKNRSDSLQLFQLFPWHKLRLRQWLTISRYLAELIQYGFMKSSSLFAIITLRADFLFVIIDSVQFDRKRLRKRKGRKGYLGFFFLD